MDEQEEAEEEAAGKKDAQAAFGEDYDSEDDGSISGDLDSDDEEGEDEIEEDLSDNELALLDKQEKADKADIEDDDDEEDGPNTMRDKSKLNKKKGGVLGKRKRPISLEYEEEHETERVA